MSIDFLSLIQTTINEISTRFRYFSTIAYSADGLSLLAAGRSKNVCIYNVQDGILLKKFEVTQNRSLDALDVGPVANGKPFFAFLIRC